MGKWGNGEMGIIRRWVKEETKWRGTIKENNSKEGR
jgi:hypothetical protein